MNNLFKNRKFQNTMFLLATTTSILYLTWRAVFTLPWKNDAVSILFGILLLLLQIDMPARQFRGQLHVGPLSSDGDGQLVFGDDHDGLLVLRVGNLDTGDLGG